MGQGDVSFLLCPASGAISHSGLTAIFFQVDLGSSVPECLHPGFYWSTDDGGSGENWSYGV